MWPLFGGTIRGTSHSILEVNSLGRRVRPNWLTSTKGKPMATRLRTGEFIGITEENIKIISSVTGEAKIYEAIGRLSATHCRERHSDEERVNKFAIALYVNPKTKEFTLVAAYWGSDGMSKSNTVARWNDEKKEFEYV